jgi:lysophospholipase L1-like esterase
MRRSIFLGGLALLAGCGRHAGPAQPEISGGRPGVHVVVLGDSLAFGTGASAAENAFMFRAYLRLRAQRPASWISNDAIGGSTASDVLRLQVPRLAHSAADVVIVCVGGNDVVRRVPAGDFAATYADLIAAAQRLQPHAQFICCGVPNVGLSPLFTGFDHVAVEQLARTDDLAVQRIARERDAAFVDLFAVTTAARGNLDRFLSEDRFHPSDFGYARLADALTPALVRAAGRSRP